MNDAALARFRRIAVEAFDLALVLADLPERLRELADWVGTMPSCLRSDVTKPPEMGSGSAKREVVSNSAPETKPASDFATDSGKGNQRGTSGQGSKPWKVKDLTGTKIGSFVGVERVGFDKHGKALWFFRCPACGETKTWSSSKVAFMVRSRATPRHACGGAPEATEALTELPTAPAEAPARAAAPADLTAPLATDEERTSPPRNPRLSGLSTLVGMKFGTWKVVARAGGALGMTYWKCHCSKCGAHKEIAALGVHGLRTRPPACGKCRLRSGAKPDEREGAEEEAAE
jgi:hypothetical protein